MPTRSGMSRPTSSQTNRPLRSANQPTYYGDNLIGAQASYEIDIWGRVRDIAASANATAEAAADALDQARLELHAELARDLHRSARPRRRGEAPLGHDRHLSLSAGSDEVAARGADRVAGRRRSGADPAQQRRGGRFGSRAQAHGSRGCDCSAGRQVGGVLFGCRARLDPCRCPRGPAPFRPTFCDGGPTSPKPNA